MNELIAVQKIAQWQKLKMLVLDSVSSPITKRVYNMALDEFYGWFQQAPRPGFTKATVSAWRVSLEERGLGSSSIIIRMSAIRKLAGEAADNGLLAPELAQGISRVKSVKSTGIRVGNWLSQRQAQALLSAPDISTVRGLRDRAILAVLVGCGLRRSEVAALTFAHVQQCEIIDHIEELDAVKDFEASERFRQLERRHSRTIGSENQSASASSPRSDDTISNEHNQPRDEDGSALNKWFLPDAEFADENVPRPLEAIQPDRLRAIAKLRNAGWSAVRASRGFKSADELLLILQPAIEEYADALARAAADSNSPRDGTPEAVRFDECVDAVLDDACGSMFSQFPAMLGLLVGEVREGSPEYRAIHRLWGAWNPLSASPLLGQLKIHLVTRLRTESRPRWMADVMSRNALERKVQQPARVNDQSSVVPGDMTNSTIDGEAAQAGALPPHVQGAGQASKSPSDATASGPRKRGRRGNAERRSAIHDEIVKYGETWRDHLADIFEELDGKEVDLGGFASQEIDLDDGQHQRASNWKDLDLADGDHRRRIIDAHRRYGD